MRSFERVAVMKWCFTDHRINLVVEPQWKIVIYKLMAVDFCTYISEVSQYLSSFVYNFPPYLS